MSQERAEYGHTASWPVGARTYDGPLPPPEAWKVLEETEVVRGWTYYVAIAQHPTDPAITLRVPLEPFHNRFLMGYSDFPEDAFRRHVTLSRVVADFGVGNKP